MLLFRVYDRQTYEEITDSVVLDANINLYHADTLKPVDREKYFFEWLGYSIPYVKGDGNWKRFVTSKGFIGALGTDIEKELQLILKKTPVGNGNIISIGEVKQID